MKERIEIVEILSVLDGKISSGVLRAESLQDLFKTMLHELMTGSIRTTTLAEMATC